MKCFAALCAELEADAEGEDALEVQVARLVDCLRAQAPADAAASVFLLSGGRVPRSANVATLRGWVQAHTGLDPAVMAEAEAHVGDAAECAALLVDTARPPPPDDAPAQVELPGLAEVLRALAGLRGRGKARAGAFRLVAEDPAGSRDASADAADAVPGAVARLWALLPCNALVWFNKLLTQGRPSGARWARPVGPLAAAVAAVVQRPEPVVAARIAAGLSPDAAGWTALAAPLTEAEAALAVAPPPAVEVEPISLHAVLLYVDGQGGRRGTFGLWHEGALVPVGRAEIVLAAAEQARLSAWIKAHTGERFGPVRQVEPSQVFALRAGGVEAASRRKAGLVLVNPEVQAWCALEPTEAHDLAHLRAALAVAGG